MISPTIFNIMMDAVSRLLDRAIRENKDTSVTTTHIFYADDGYIAGICGQIVQMVVDNATKLFSESVYTLIVLRKNL